MIHPILVNLGILSYLSGAHGDIFGHHIHFLLRCVDDILGPAKQSSVAILYPAKAPAATVVAKTMAARNLFFILILLTKLNHFAKNARELFLVFELDFNLVLSTRALYANICVKHLT